MMNRQEMRRLAEEIDQLKDSGHELDGFERVNAKVAKSPGAVVILEMSGKDISAISVAAREAGEDVNDFMRKAALSRVAELKAKRKKASA
jgi:Ribonuclease G/E